MSESSKPGPERKSMLWPIDALARYIGRLLFGK